MYQNQLKVLSAKPFQSQKWYTGAVWWCQKDIVEKEAEEEQQLEKDVDLAPHEHERASKGPYRSFVIPDVPKTDDDSYFDQTKTRIKTLIENRLKEMGPTKIISKRVVQQQEKSNYIYSPQVRG